MVEATGIFCKLGARAHLRTITQQVFYSNKQTQLSSASSSSASLKKFSQNDVLFAFQVISAVKLGIWNIYFVACSANSTALS